MPPNKIIYLHTRELRWVTISLRNDGIMEYRVKHDHTVSIEDVKETEKTVEVIGGGKSFPNLIIAGKFSTLDINVRDYMATEEANRFTLADAFVINSLPQKFLANLYMMFNKPPRPTLAFTKEEEAVKWLYKFL